MQSTTHYIEKALTDIYPTGEIRALTRIIWEEVCQLSPVEVILRKNETLAPIYRAQIESIVKRLQQREPIQYILGHTWFNGLRIEVAPGVLIPRPETEELTRLIIDENRTCPTHRIADIGTGSGCIALDLARNFKGCRVEGWDISPKALLIAEQNSRILNIPVTWIRRDVLHTTLLAEDFGCYDLIVSNPPYIVPSEKAAMEPQVIDHEPHTALFVPEDDPLLFYRAIARCGQSLLRSGGKLYAEINPLFAQETADLLEALHYSNIILRTDLSGRERFISATFEKK